jgi:hypothetical protein
MILKRIWGCADDSPQANKLVVGARRNMVNVEIMSNRAIV